MTQELVLTHGEIALVDDEDWEDVSQFRWHTRGKGTNHVYAERSFVKDGRIQHELLHRRIMQTPPGLEVHHINHDGFDCRRANLVNVTKFVNQQNRLISSNNTTGYPGVYFDPRWVRRWKAVVCRNGKRVNLGNHMTAEEAHRACERYRKLHSTEFVAGSVDLRTCLS